MFNTYFWIEVDVDNEQYLVVFGPYLSFDQAAEILDQHVDTFLAVESLDGRNYTASITERFADGSQSWMALNTKITERRIRN